MVDVLRKRPEVECVRGVERRAKVGSRGEKHENDLDAVPFDPDHRPFVEYLVRHRIDTVVQIGLAPDRVGRRASRVTEEADVIGTMCLGAAIGSVGGPVRNWVIASSSAVYPIGSDSPLVSGEAARVDSGGDSPSVAILEAEDYARDVARRGPHINVSILRLQQLVGPGIDGDLASLLRLPSVPMPIGFDPSIQLLHVDDAAEALAFACRVGLAGLYNVASSGSIHWSAAALRAGLRAVPVLPLGAGVAAPILMRLGIPHLPENLFDLLRFGHVVDTVKIEEAGWHPAHDQGSCLSSGVRSMTGRRLPRWVVATSKSW